MKIKRFCKKLVLNKRTIVNLGNNEMNAVHGGITGMKGSCHTFCNADPELSICLCVYTGYTDCDTYCPCP